MLEIFSCSSGRCNDAYVVRRHYSILSAHTKKNENKKRYVSFNLPENPIRMCLILNIVCYKPCMNWILLSIFAPPCPPSLPYLYKHKAKNWSEEENWSELNLRWTNMSIETIPKLYNKLIIEINVLNFATFFNRCKLNLFYVYCIKKKMNISVNILFLILFSLFRN